MPSFNGGKFNPSNVVTADLEVDSGTISVDTDHGVIVGNVSGGPVTIGHATSETTVSDNLTVAGNYTFGSYKKCFHAEVDVRQVHNDDNTVSIAVGPIIPRYSIITQIVAVVKTQSDITANSGAHLVNIRSGAASQSADTDIGSAGAEVLGAGLAATLSSDSASATDIDLRTNIKDVWVSNTPISAATTADIQLYVCNVAGNGGTDATAGTLSVYVEYYGMD